MRSKKTRISVLAAVISVIAVSAYSQYSTYSPYTRFGLGDLAMQGFGQNMAMGGTGIAIQDGNKLNYLNPAAYAARDSMSVLLDFGINTFVNQYQTSELSNTWWNANFHHIALSVPIGKHFAMGTGLVPYSAVGYNLKQEYNDLGTGDPVDFYHKGSGGVMKFFLGLSGKAFDRISVGVNMNYLLGDIKRERLLVFPQSTVFAQTSSLDEIRLSHTYFSFGLQYKEVFADKFFFTLGATYEMEATLSSAILSTITNSFPGTSSSLNDSTAVYTTVDVNSGFTGGSIVIPSKIGGGIALGIPNKLTLTADYNLQDWLGVNNDFLISDGFNLTTARSMNAGIEYTPDFEAFRGYHKLMSYRLGGYYSESYVKVNDYQLNDYGITFGVGLPMGKTKSSFNAAFTFGTRGTTEDNLIKENYGILTFSVTLHDLWFYKRKFD